MYKRCAFGASANSSFFRWFFIFNGLLYFWPLTTHFSLYALTHTHITVIVFHWQRISIPFDHIDIVREHCYKQ